MNPRAAAHRILTEVREGALSGQAASRVLPGVRPPDRGLALEIALGCLRLRGRLDARIGAVADRPTRRIDADVLDWLRIGAHQLTELRTPDHAAVGETMRAARPSLGRGRAGYLNAVLRALARRPGADPFPSLEADPVAHLTSWGSHPEWLIRRWLDRWPLGDVRRLVEHHNRPPGVVLRLLGGPAGPAPPSVPGLPDGVELSPVRGWPRSFTLTKGTPEAALAGLPAVVQDPAASAVIDCLCASAELSGRQTGHVGPVVDACAAPGTKALGLAAACGVPVAALDISRRRLDRLGAAVRRLGLPVRRAVADARRLPVAGAGTVLADVPCTGTGVLRRRADARWRLRPQSLADLVALQRGILDGCARAVRPGGLLVYGTCSLEHEENEGQVDAFLDRRSDFRREPPEWRGPAPVPEGCITAWGDLFVRPWLTGTDGSYAARLRRIA